MHSHIFGFLMSQLMRFPELLEYKNAIFNGEQEKESIICVRIEKSVPRDHHLSSLGKPLDAKRDPGDVFFYPTLTLMIYGPRHEISNNVVCATSKASDQPAHTRILIRVFASRLNILLVLSY